MENWIEEVQKTLDYILVNLDKTDINFYDIARLRNYSPYHFHRKFKEITGESVKSCLRRLRFEKAVIEIRNSEKSITEIAFDSGYETLESFSKAFKKRMGISPLDLRNKDSWYGRTLSYSHIHYLEKNNISDWVISSDLEDSMLVKILNLPPMQFLCMENIGDYWKLPSTWNKFKKVIRENKIQTDLSFFMTIFFDHHNNIPMREKKTYVCNKALLKEELPKGTFEYSFSGGKYAVFTHMGSYDEIGIVWDDFVNNFLSKRRWKLNPELPSLEWYQNNADKLKSDLWLTYLCEPVL